MEFDELKIPCPNHPETHLRGGGAHNASYVVGAKSEKAKELNGVGWCPVCQCYRAFTQKK